MAGHLAAAGHEVTVYNRTEAKADAWCQELFALMDQAEAHLAAADTADDGIADAVLAVTPQSWNDGPGKATLDDARSSLRTAHQELKSANDDGRAAIRALRDAIGDVTSS